MQGTARREGLKGKAALPTASKTLAIWTPARPPPARHVPGAATRRGAREADGTEQTATVHSGGGWEAQGAAPGLTWTVSCARSSACSLSASCRRMAAASPPAAGAQCRRLSLPLGRKPNARPASSPCAALSRSTEQPRVPCGSCARSAPPHPRARVRPPAGTPRNQEHHQQHSPHCRGGLLRAAPSCAPHLRAACQAQRLQQNGVFGRELPTPQSPPALRGRPKVMEDVVQMLRVHSDGPGAPTTSLGSPLHPWTTLTIRTFPNAQSEPPGCGFMPPPHALSSAPTHQRLPPLAQFTSPSISTRPTPAALPHGSPRL